MLQTIHRLARHNGLKFLVVLLVWTIVLLFILKVYNNENPYFDRNNEIQRKKKITNFLKNRKILARSTGQQQLQFGYELFFDNNKARSEEQIIAAIEAEHPSIAFRYWHTHIKGAKAPRKNACATFPSILKLKYYNKYWQTFANGNTTIQLYNAYYDARAALKQPLVRLLGMSNEIEFGKQTIYCQLWYDNAVAPQIIKATVFLSIWNLKWNKSRAYNFPFLICCELPEATTNAKRIPRVVSLTAKKCDTASNSLRIHYELPSAAANSNSNKKFAICVKGMDYPYTDISARLVEWIELQLMLGASKIYFYELELHANVSKVLQHYKQRGLIDVRPITLANGAPSLANLQHYLLDAELMRKRLNELIPYNDCFYRNMYRYEYIALQDIDEVLMPLGNLTNWSDLMATTAHQMHTPQCPNGYASYCFRNVYFSKPNSSSPYASDIPRFMHMLQNVERNRTHTRTGYNTKCFHRTDQAVALHNHLPRAWLQACSAAHFDASIAQLQHYRERPVLKDTVYDTNIWRFKDELLQRSLDALSEIGFIHETVLNISSALS